MMQKTKVDLFHDHLNECEQCRDRPLNLCPVGQQLLEDSIWEGTRLKYSKRPKSVGGIAARRWETKGGKYWIVVHRTPTGWSYSTDNGGGNLGDVTEEGAIELINGFIQDALVLDGHHLKEVEVEGEGDAMGKETLEEVLIRCNYDQEEIDALLKRAECVKGMSMSAQVKRDLEDAEDLRVFGSANEVESSCSTLRPKYSYGCLTERLRASHAQQVGDPDIA